MRSQPSRDPPGAGIRRRARAIALAGQRGARASASTLIVSMLVIAGCVPVVGPIYRPAAPGGEVLGAHCPPEPRSVIRFERQGVLVSARASYVAADEIRVQVTFEVPAGKVVRLADRSVEVSVAGRPGQKGELVDQRSRLQPDAARRGAPMPGATLGHEPGLFEGWPTPYDPPSGRYAKTKLASYGYEARLRLPASDAFTLRLPAFCVNDTEVELPLVELTRHIDLYVAPINC